MGNGFDSSFDESVHLQPPPSRTFLFTSVTQAPVATLHTVPEPHCALPVQPHTFESGFPHGWHQFASAGASSWATMALLFTLPDR